MLYTGYYANMKRVPKNSNYTFVAISLTKPTWFVTNFTFQTDITLAPNNFDEVEKLREGDEKAKERYVERIKKNINKIKEKYYNDNDYIFLCHEKDADDCHRSLLRKCLNEAGIECREIYFEKDSSATTAEQMKMEGVL